MLEPCRTRCLGALVLAVYAIAMMALGFVQHDDGRATDSAPSAQSLVAYQLPGVVAVPLCQHGRDQSGHVPDDHGPGGHACCDACIIAHAPGLGWVVASTIPDPQAGAIVYVALDAAIDAPLRRAEPTSRGPPTA